SLRSTLFPYTTLFRSVDGGEEGVAEVARAAVAHRGGDGDEAGEVFILAAQAIGDPRAHRRADEVGGAAVQEERRGAVGDAYGLRSEEHTSELQSPDQI